MFKLSEDIESTYPGLSEKEFTRKELKEEVYDKIIDHKIYYCFENWMSEMRRQSLVIQNFPSDAELKEYALDVSREIVVRSYENGYSKDTRRKASKSESHIIFNVVYGALLEARCLSTNKEHSYSRLSDVSNTAEFIGMLMLPEANSYLTFYNPIRDFWEC